MRLSHNFCIEINKHTFSQLSKGKGQKFVLYILSFWKTPQIFKCHNTMYLSIYNPISWILICAEFWNNFFLKKVVTLHQMAGLCLVHWMSLSELCKKVKTFGVFLGFLWVVDPNNVLCSLIPHKLLIMWHSRFTFHLGVILTSQKSTKDITPCSAKGRTSWFW